MTSVNEYELTGPELRVVQLLAEGLSVEQIAERSGHTIPSTKARLRAAFHQLGIGTHFDGDAPLSSPIRHYLYAWEQVVRAGDAEEKLIALRIMDRAAEDAGRPLHLHHTARSRGLISMLMSYGRGELNVLPPWVEQPGDEALTWRAAADEMREAA